jgi:hippurate hydrolase
MKYPAVINPKKETDHVIRLAKKWFGEVNFSQDECPLMAGEDFSYFLQEKPGCFFALGTMKVGKQLMTLHTSTYDYNDHLISSGAYFFARIVEDRLGVEFIKV